MRAKIRGSEIYFDITGIHTELCGNKIIERPVLFLIHGGPGGNHLHFKKDSNQLQNVAQLVFIDQRGCGWSKKTKQTDYSLENNIEDIEALRKYLGHKKICILGHSYGGVVAQGYSIRYRKNVEKLILCATIPSYHFIEEAKNNLKTIGSKSQIAICNKFLWNGSFTNAKEVDRYFQIMDSLYYFSKQKNKKHLLKRSKNISPSWENVFSYEALNNGFGDFLHKFNFIPHLKKIIAPTLILAGNNDWICTPKQSEIIASHIPNAKLKIFKNCSHIIATDVPNLYIKTVSNFLKKK